MMYKNKRFLAVIPARGGSKRLPGKNIKLLVGKPLIAWTIGAGQKSEYIDKLIVTSENEDILRLSNNLGVTIIKRPDELASDSATTFDAVKHAIETIDGEYDYIVLLQPTSPFRNEYHIDEAIELMHSKNACAVVSVCEVEHCPLWANIIPANGDMTGFLSEDIKNKRSQELGTYYRINGAIYICRIAAFIEQGTFFLKSRTFAYCMNRNNSVDIDEEIDFELATVIMRSGIACS